jgi:hypothetical protein
MTSWLFFAETLRLYLHDSMNTYNLTRLGIVYPEHTFFPIDIRTYIQYTYT